MKNKIDEKGHLRVVKLLIIFFVYISLNLSNFLQKITSNTGKKKKTFRIPTKLTKTTGEYCFTL